MKNFRITTLLMATIALLSFSACSDDESDDDNSGGKKSPTSSSFTFDGNSYDMEAGLVIDYGAIEVEPFLPATHYNYDFIIIDAPIHFVQDTAGDYYVPDTSATISVYVELLSPDTNNFSAGTFNFIHEDSVNAASTAGKHFFTYGEVELDNDGVVDGDFDGPEYEMTGGSIVVSGTSVSNYSVNYNIQTSGGKTLSGTYSGSFIYEDDF